MFLHLVGKIYTTFCINIHNQLISANSQTNINQVSLPPGAEFTFRHALMHGCRSAVEGAPPWPRASTCGRSDLFLITGMVACPRGVRWRHSDVPCFAFRIQHGVCAWHCSIELQYCTLFFHNQDPEISRNFWSRFVIRRYEKNSEFYWFFSNFFWKNIFRPEKIKFFRSDFF